MDEARAMAEAARFWGRRFVRVAEVRRGANVTLRLEEARGGGRTRACWLRLGRAPGAEGAAGLDFEMRVLRGVAGVARPIAGRGGRMRTRIGWEGAMRHACLFENAEGREMGLGAEDVRRFGAALAGLHEALRGVGGVAGRRVEAEAACVEAARWLRRAGEGALAEEVEQAGPALRAGVAGAEVGVCHGDAWLGNARVEGERVTFLDFEDCAWGPLALDLATVARWLRREPDAAGLWGALLDGYRGVRALSAGDLAAMPALVALAEVRSAGVLARFWGVTPAMWGEVGEWVRGRIAEAAGSNGQGGP